MKRKILVPIFVILLIFVFTITFIFTNAKKLQEDTCLHVVNLALVHLLKQKELKEKVNPTKEWRRLSLDEQQYLLNLIPEENRTECSGFILFDVEQNSNKLPRSKLTGY